MEKKILRGWLVGRRRLHVQLIHVKGVKIQRSKEGVDGRIGRQWPWANFSRVFAPKIRSERTVAGKGWSVCDFCFFQANLCEGNLVESVREKRDNWSVNFLLENGGDEEIKYTGEGSESHIEEERKLSLGQGEVRQQVEVEQTYFWWLQSP